MGVEIAYMQDKSDQIRDMLGYLQNNIVFAGVARILDIMDDRGGFADVEDDRPLPGSEWRLELYRERAARYSADAAVLGNAVQMVTEGMEVSEYVRRTTTTSWISGFAASMRSVICPVKP